MGALDQPTEAPRQASNAGVGEIAAGAYQPGTTYMRDISPMPGAFTSNGDVQLISNPGSIAGAEGGAVPNALSGLGAQYSESAKQAEETRLLKAGETAKANFDASKETADVILEKGKAPVLNTALDKPLSELNIHVGEGVTDQEKQALLDAVQKDWGKQVTVDKGLDESTNDGDGNGGGGGGGGGDCNGGDCNGGGGGGGGGGGDDNNLGPDGEVTPPTPAPNDNARKPYSKDSLDLSRGAAETHIKSGDRVAPNGWFSRMSPALMNAMANMSPEELEEFLKEHPDLAKEKSDMETEMAEESKSRTEKGDTEGAAAIDQFAKDFKAPTGEFKDNLRAYSDATKDGGQPSAEVTDKLMSPALQKAITSELIDRAAQKLIDAPDSPYKGMDLSKETKSVDDAKKLGDLYKAASGVVTDKASVDELLKIRGTGTKRVKLDM